MKGANLLRRFAKECRAFAYDCAEEKAPIPIVGMFEDGEGGHCAVGWVLFRTEPEAQSTFDTFFELSAMVHGILAAQIAGRPIEFRTLKDRWVAEKVA